MKKSTRFWIKSKVSILISKLPDMKKVRTITRKQAFTALKDKVRRKK